jgi:hypothetical protein
LEELFFPPRLKTEAIEEGEELNVRCPDKSGLLNMEY